MSSIKNALLCLNHSNSVKCNIVSSFFFFFPFPVNLPIDFVSDVSDA